MDRVENILPFWPVAAEEVSRAAWPFAFHLNEKLRWSKFLCRNANLVRCINPRTNRVDLPVRVLASHCDFHGTDEQRVASELLRRFDREIYFDLSTYLSDALAIVSRSAHDTRAALFRDLMAETSDPWNYSGPDIPNRKQINVSGYLFCVDAAHTLLLNWDHELRRVADGEWLTLWRAGLQRRGAAEGGRKSAQTRARSQRAPTDKVVAMYRALQSQGHLERNIAATLASRLNVTADHVRRVYRASTKPA